MLKRKLLAVALPVLSALTIVGSGFAAWNFQESSATNSTSYGFEVAEIQNFDLNKFTYKLSDDTTPIPEDLGLTLYLDQGGFVNKGNLNEGISVKKADGTEITSLTITYTFDEETYNYYLGGTISLTTSLSLTGGLDEYVSYNGVVTDAQFKKDTGNEKVFTYTYNFADTEFSYKEGKKPQSEPEYNSMKTALEGSKVNISVSLSITNP